MNHDNKHDVTTNPSPATNVSPCCSAERQETCCEPTDKAECCGTAEAPRGNGCGCNS